MNLKLRFKNKTTCIAIVTLAISFIYSCLGMIGIVPKISENDVLMVIKQLIDLLALMGILVDPTTAGIGDSARALTYFEPKTVENIYDKFPVGGEAEGNTDVQHENKDPKDPEV